MARRPEVVKAIPEGAPIVSKTHRVPDVVSSSSDRAIWQRGQIQHARSSSQPCLYGDGWLRRDAVRIVCDEEIERFLHLEFAPGVPPEGVNPARIIAGQELLTRENLAMPFVRRKRGVKSRQSPYGSDEDIVPQTVNGNVSTLPYNPLVWPQWLVGKVRNTADDVSGSGVLVGPRHVLTASHVVSSEWIPGDSIEESDTLLAPTDFLPGLLKGSSPLVSKNSDGTKLAFFLGAPVSVIAIYAATNFGFAEPGQKVKSKLNFSRDYAVLVLSKRIGDVLGWADVANDYTIPPGYSKSMTSCMDWKSYCDPKTYQILGYPNTLDDVPAGDFAAKVLKAQWYTSKQQGVLMGTFADTWPGMSGGPLWLFQQGMQNPLVYGVDSFESKANCFYGKVGDPYEVGPKQWLSGCFNFFAGGKTMKAIVNAARAEMP